MIITNVVLAGTTRPGLLVHGHHGVSVSVVYRCEIESTLERLRKLERELYSKEKELEERERRLRLWEERLMERSNMTPSPNSLLMERTNISPVSRSLFTQMCVEKNNLLIPVFNLGPRLLSFSSAISFSSSHQCPSVPPGLSSARTLRTPTAQGSAALG